MRNNTALALQRLVVLFGQMLQSSPGIGSLYSLSVCHAEEESYTAFTLGRNMFTLITTAICFTL